MKYLLFYYIHIEMGKVFSGPSLVSRAGDVG